MMNYLSKALRGIDLISEYSAKLFSFLVIPMVCLEVFEIIKRTFLDSPTTWSWELVAMLYGAHMIIGAAWVLKEDGHVRTDLFFSKMSPKAKALVNVIFFTLIFFVYVGVMIWKTFGNAVYSWQIDERTFSTWAPPYYPLKTVIAISFILVGLQGLATWIRNLVFLIKGEEI